LLLMSASFWRTSVLVSGVSAAEIRFCDAITVTPFVKFYTQEIYSNTICQVQKNESNKPLFGREAGREDFIYI